MGLAAVSNLASNGAGTLAEAEGNIGRLLASTRPLNRLVGALLLLNRLAQLLEAGAAAGTGAAVTGVARAASEGVTADATADAAAAVDAVVVDLSATWGDADRPAAAAVTAATAAVALGPAAAGAFASDSEPALTVCGLAAAPRAVAAVVVATAVGSSTMSVAETGASVHSMRGLTSTCLEERCSWDGCWGAAVLATVTVAAVAIDGDATGSEQLTIGTLATGAVWSSTDTDTEFELLLLCGCCW